MVKPTLLATFFVLKLPKSFRTYNFSPFTCISNARTEREFSKELIHVLVTVSPHFGNLEISTRILLKTHAWSNSCMSVKLMPPLLNVLPPLTAKYYTDL
jgi:hypothetical protein